MVKATKIKPRKKFNLWNILRAKNSQSAVFRRHTIADHYRITLILNIAHLVITYSCVLQIVSQLLFIVPAFAVSVQTFPSDVTLYADTYIDLICDHNITDTVDTVVDISFMWTAHDSNGTSIDIGSDGYSITDQSNNSTLRIERLAIPRDNMTVYSCLISVTPSAGSVYITGKVSNINDLTLSVSSKLSVQIKASQSNCNKDVFGSHFLCALHILFFIFLLWNTYVVRQCWNTCMLSKNMHSAKHSVYVTLS